MFYAGIAKYAAASSILLVSAACASTSPANDGPPDGLTDDVRLGEEVDRVCFTSTIDSFQNAERKTVVVEEGNDHYLIEIFGTCSNLRNAQSLGIASTGSCLQRGDKLIVSDSAFGFDRNDSLSTSRCTVSRMYNWDPKALENDAEE